MKIKLIAYISSGMLSLFDRNSLTVEKVLPYVSFGTSPPLPTGYINIGEAEIDFEFLPEDQIIGNAIVALRAKAADIRAKATAESTEIEVKVQQLLAIENKPSEPDLETELRGAWEGQGNDVSFEQWVVDMAANPDGVFQKSAAALSRRWGIAKKGK